MIIQVNIHTCDIYKKTEVESERVDIYSDPLVSPFQGWDTKDGFLVCDECHKKIGDGRLNFSQFVEILGTVNV